MSHPLVAVIMGSSSDWDTMKHAADVLDQFGVDHERHIVSAHRTPVWMAEFASGAEARGIEVIIAGADGAAGSRGSGSERRASGPRFAAIDRADARRRSRRHAGYRQSGRHQRWD